MDGVTTQKEVTIRVKKNS